MMEKNEDKLRQEILNEASKRADRIVVRGKKDAENTLKKAKEESESKRKKRVAEAKTEAGELHSEKCAEIEKVLNDMWLNIREKCINSMFDTWTNELFAQPAGSKKRMDDLKILISYAVASINCPEITLKVPTADIPFVTEEWLKSFLPETAFTVKESKRTKYGVIAQSADGNMVYDNSIEAVLQRKRELLRSRIADKSFMDLIKKKV